jgi:hypothetical protein
MCLDMRERLHVYGHILSWLLLLVVALILNDVATDIVHSASPESTGVRIALRLSLVFALVLFTIFISWARAKWPLHLESKVSGLLQDLTGRAGGSGVPIMTPPHEGFHPPRSSNSSSSSSAFHPAAASVFQRQRTPFVHPPSLDLSNKQQHQQPLAFSLQ